jgi:hypothetical protein
MSVTLFIIVSWFLGLCGTFDVLRQPGDAFRAAEHSKGTWLTVEVAGTLLSFTGIFTWAAYSIWVRPSVVKAGGRRRRKGVFVATFLKELSTQGTSSSSRSSRSQSPSSTNAWSSSTKEAPKRCLACGGSGKRSCSSCSGRGDVYTPNATPTTAAYLRCSSCSGTGNTTCYSCGGRGTSSV